MTDQALLDRLAGIHAARERAHMAPTIAAFRAVLDEHPDDPHVLYRVGGAYDTDGQEEVAAGFYERALAAGLDGEDLFGLYLGYGSTLRNLDRLEESVELFARARAEFPDSAALVVFEALTLHSAGRPGPALAQVLLLVADRLDDPGIARYEVALRGYAADLSAT